MLSIEPWTLSAPIVVVIEVVPEPDTSPDSVIVGFGIAALITSKPTLLFVVVLAS